MNNDILVIPNKLVDAPQSASDFMALVATKGFAEACKEAGLARKEASLLLARARVEEIAPYLPPTTLEARNLIKSTLHQILLNGEDKDRIGAARALMNDPDLGFKNEGPTVELTISDEVRKMPVTLQWERHREETKDDKP